MPGLTRSAVVRTVYKQEKEVCSCLISTKNTMCNNGETSTASNMIRGAEYDNSLNLSLSTMADHVCAGQLPKAENGVEMDCLKSTRQERRAIRGEIKKCALKLRRKGMCDNSVERSAALNAAALLSRVWRTGIGHQAAIELVRDVLAENEEEARALGIDPADRASIACLFSPPPSSKRSRTRRFPSPASLLNDAVLSLLLSCSFRILRRLKHREARWDRSAIRRCFHRLGQVWARGLSSLTSHVENQSG
jgi:hypothetical protein